MNSKVEIWGSSQAEETQMEFLIEYYLTACLSDCLPVNSSNHLSVCLSVYRSVENGLVELMDINISKMITW